MVAERSVHIVEKLGWGGMAMVYKAHDPTLRRFVAIKVMLSHLAGEEEFVQRFLREAQEAAGLHARGRPPQLQQHRVSLRCCGGTLSFRAAG